jgi:hypothetical protein
MIDDKRNREEMPNHRHDRPKDVRSAEAPLSEKSMHEVEQADQSQPTPFEAGRKYQVKKDYAYLNHAFRQVEERVSVCQSYEQNDLWSHSNK